MLAERAGQAGPGLLCRSRSAIRRRRFISILNEALTVADCLAVGEFLGETQFATALSAHKSGVRVLAAPRELTALDTLTPHSTEALDRGLRRDFAPTILDLPSVWTAWTNRAFKWPTASCWSPAFPCRMSIWCVANCGSDNAKAGRVPLTLVCNGVTCRAAEHALDKSGGTGDRPVLRHHRAGRCARDGAACNRGWNSRPSAAERNWKSRSPCSPTA